MADGGRGGRMVDLRAAGRCLTVCCNAPAGRPRYRSVQQWPPRSADPGRAKSTGPQPSAAGAKIPSPPDGGTGAGNALIGVPSRPGVLRPPIALLLAVAAALAVNTVGTGGDAHADHDHAEVVIHIEHSDEPVHKNVTVAVGGAVTWRDAGYAGVMHHILSGTSSDDWSDMPIDSGRFGGGVPDSSFVFRFNEADTYQWVCQIHPWITGTVTVVDDTHARPSSDSHATPPYPDWSRLHNSMIAVADAYNHRVQVFYPNGTLAFAFGQYGHDLGMLDSPVDVAFGGDQRIAVAGHGGVQVFHPDGVLRIPSAAIGVAVDGGSGRIATVEYGDSRIWVHHPNGTIAFAFGSYGAGPRQFVSPVDVAFGPDGRIAVADPGHYDEVFHPNGTFMFETKGLFDDYGAPNGIAFDPNGGTVSTSFQNGWIAHHNSSGAHVGYPDVELVPQAPGSDPLSYSRFVAQNPVDVAALPDGRIVVLSGRGIVNVFNPNGTVALAFGPYVASGQVSSPSGIDVFHGPAFPGAGADGAPHPTVDVAGLAVQGGRFNFTAAGDADRLTIDVSGLAVQGGPPLDGPAPNTAIFPPSGFTVAASFATLSFPPGVTAAHVPDDGRLALRVSADVPDDARVQAALAYEGSGRVELQRVVEVGGEQGRVEFDMPVRILLNGQAGARAFYIDGADGAITPIDRTCAADDTARVHRHMGGAGECQMDSADGGKIIYTYHFTRFGTVLSEHAAPPAFRTCAVRPGSPSLGVNVRPGEHSAPVQQALINSGSAPFAHVDITATPWRGDLPASVTEVSMSGPGGSYTALAEQGIPVARGLGGGEVAPLWFRLNLIPYGETQAGTLVQTVTYEAVCSTP